MRVQFELTRSGRELDGVIVMRPLEAWSDANNVLNRKLSGFVMHEGNFARALSLWRAAAFGDESPSLSRQPGRSEHAKRKFSVNAGPLPLSDVLDAIVRAHGALSWMVSYKAAPATLETMVVDLHTFDGEATLTQHYPRQE